MIFHVKKNKLLLVFFFSYYITPSGNMKNDGKIIIFMSFIITYLSIIVCKDQKQNRNIYLLFFS